MQPAVETLKRIFGPNVDEVFSLSLTPTRDLNDSYNIAKISNRIYIEANSQVGLCRAAYDYLKNACNCIVSWSGNNVHIPDKLPDYSATVRSPYQFHYYMNVVTHGYTTPYWDWKRWEQEIDWMAIHGINMPLIGGAHEAILNRVFLFLGLTQDECNQYFTGPAHFPWNRMGNIAGVDSPLPTNYFQKQLALAHQILDRLKLLGMHPIVHAFAGFVPQSIKRIYPQEEIRNIQWFEQFTSKYCCYLLSPKSQLFSKIGNMYILEWEKEFGKGEFYLADSFNEMDVPISADPTIAAKELADYGASVYCSIKDANPNAVWVMQGWTFGYKRKFWSPDRIASLLSKVPDDKMIILDLANEYYSLKWKCEPCWKSCKGYFNKKWIFSVIPNMGGNTPINGQVELYTTLSIEALKYENKGNLIGYGFAPEGIENNELIYELVSDMGWVSAPLDFKKWYSNYCLQRYGYYSKNFEMAMNLFMKSCYSFVAHPISAYMENPYKLLSEKYPFKLFSTIEFEKGIQAFLENYDYCKGNKLYIYDAIELVGQLLQYKANKIVKKVVSQNKIGKLDRAIELLESADKLLASHPLLNLEKWLMYARQWGDNDIEKAYYESNARKLITVWEIPDLSEYAAKGWSGLIRDYYVPRWKLYTKASKEAIAEWEMKWVKSTGVSPIKAFDQPLESAITIFKKYKSKK